MVQDHAPGIMKVGKGGRPTTPLRQEARFVDGSRSVSDKVRGFTAGGVDYITKPFQAEEVIARAKNHLTLYQLQRQQRDLFRRFATKEVANELLESGFALGGRYVEATAMFSDIRSFTSITESQSPAATIELLK